MELFGIWVEAAERTERLPGYQPGVTYACLYLRDLSMGDALMPFGLEVLPASSLSETDEMQAGAAESVTAGESVPENGTKEAVPATSVQLGENEPLPPEPVETEESLETEETQEQIDPMEIESEFEVVDESYFDDALFIGDSRVVGLGSYAGFPNATYAASVGLGIYTLLDKKFVQIEGSSQKQTVRDLLSQKQYGKIYIKVGANEMGTGTEERFRKTYREVVEEIISLQPNAVIFVQGVLHVSEKKSKGEKYINNANIDVRNEGLAELADGKRIFYLDMNYLYDDENGNMAANYTGDGIHLKAQYYGAWRQYLLEHGIVKPGMLSGGVAESGETGESEDVPEPSAGGTAGEDETGAADGETNLP